jgi:prolyl-tRNA editing enzyme YbaK/EbsC (Cys-tRNA(Pro) deacylase)
MSNLLEKKTVQKVNQFFININENIDLIILDETAKTAKDAAKSLKLKEVGAIIKSLLFKNKKNNDYYLCLVSGDQYISINKLSIIIKGEIIKANADECKKITGFSIGGISPVAHTYSPNRIFIDKNLEKYNKIYGAAGHPYVVFGISFAKLCSITGGEVRSIVE